ncbi:hypothetical protein [Marinisporobacter balticus]|uniref:Uncharacterized protein n=1 Tax=Marinisporobacter balticus TaxID=2018667 RepID=A0A4R2L579_9FIRM|nr:hypothetical protein [Marinisporobacter balticus]TCO79159.1 hypothetical protein EV214_103211 [Marinisporobacter balticus]
MKKILFGRVLGTYFIVKVINLISGFSYNIFSDKLNLPNLFIDLGIFLLVYSVVSLVSHKFENIQKDVR